MGQIGYIWGYALIFAFLIGFLCGYGYNFAVKIIFKGENEKVSDKEDLLIVLEAMGSKTLGLSQTEREAINQAINHVKNDEINLAKRIKNMIEANGATTEDIVKFCDIFIATKEKENDATA